MKTAFISTNAVMAARYGRSYSAVVALTAVPLCLSSVTGMASLVAAKVWGKRPVYLASFVLIFIGTLVTMKMLDNYGGCMAGRIFQGFGWGAFDVLMLASIQETFFVSGVWRRRTADTDGKLTRPGTRATVSHRHLQHSHHGRHVGGPSFRRAGVAQRSALHPPV
jgi:hypothetical protein